MVTFLFLWIAQAELPRLSIDAAPPRTIFLHQLRMEFSKKAVFVGERFIVDFVLYSEQPFEEVEVARFPEFDGFWSENVALRQGRLILTRAKGVFKLVLGSYHLIPMVSRMDLRIEPMHLILKGSGKRLVSSGKLPVLYPLPSPGPETHAVGTLSVHFPEKVTFVPYEPTVLKIILQGEANFPEISAPVFSFPRHVEVVTQQSFINGQNSYAAKTFEYLMINHTGEPFEIPKLSFSYFDPKKRRYSEIPIGPIPMVPVTGIQVAAVSPSSPSPDRPRNVFHSPIIWAVNFLFVIFLAYLAIRFRKPSIPVAKYETVEKEPGFLDKFQAAIVLGDEAGATRALLDEIEHWRRANPFHSTKIEMIKLEAEQYLYAPEKPRDYRAQGLRERFLNITRTHVA